MGVFPQVNRLVFAGNLWLINFLNKIYKEYVGSMLSPSGRKLIYPDIKEATINRALDTRMYPG